MKYDFMGLIVELQQHGKLVKELNPSFLVLISKKEATCGLNDFRPISLIEDIYKILSKALANRLSKILD